MSEPGSQSVEKTVAKHIGVEELAPGGLDLTPGCIDRARAARGEGPLAG